MVAAVAHHNEHAWDNNPVPRVATADEIAALVVFLASDEAGYITGAEIAIDGGLLAGPKCSTSTAAAVLRRVAAGTNTRCAVILCRHAHPARRRLHKIARRCRGQLDQGAAVDPRRGRRPALGMGERAALAQVWVIRGLGEAQHRRHAGIHAGEDTFPLARVRAGEPLREGRAQVRPAGRIARQANSAGNSSTRTSSA